MIYKEEIIGVGTWDLVYSRDSVDTTELDNIAYYLYCSGVYSINGMDDGIKSSVDQTTFKSINSAYINVSPYYQEAHHIIRMEKIDKIKNNIKNL